MVPEEGQILAGPDFSEPGPTEKKVIVRQVNCP
jgi:hypothetical protein